MIFMRMFQVRVKVSNPQNPDLQFEEDFWVDTGALYSFVPEDRLHSIKGEPLPCPVIFAPKGLMYLLGATALETFGVEADPVTKSLKPISAIICGFLASR
jgi:predicted aspartyl protease